MKSALPKLWLSVFFVWALLAECQRIPTGTGVSFVHENAPGTITLQATGQGVGMPSIEQDAKKNAFETLLFIGLPAAANSSYRLPLIENRNEQSTFFNDFKAQQKYQPFINNIRTVSKAHRLTADNKLAVTFEMTINFEALRRYLEQQGIIRKFGY